MGLVIAAGLLVYLVLMVFARRNAPLDTEREERWFVVHAPGPLRRALHYADRRVVGGAALVFLFVVVFVAAMAVGWLFDTIDEERGFARLARASAEFGADHEPDASNGMLEAVTQCGATGWRLVFFAASAAIPAWRHRPPAVLGSFAAIGVGVSLLNNGLKHRVPRERPAVPQLTSFGGYSSPSG